MKLKFTFTVLILAFVFTFNAAQTYISLAVPPSSVEEIEIAITAFEDSHPGVNVLVVSKNAPDYDTDTESYLDSMEDYATSADVLIVDGASLSPEATSYFLDLSPLIDIDATLNSSDFHEKAWQAYQWDNATWALPVALDTIGLVYDPIAFDAADLTYPDGTWTMTEIENAARTLTVDGTPGFVVQRSRFASFVVSQSGAPTFADGAVTFDQAEPVLTTLSALFEERVFDLGNNQGAPLTVDNAFSMGTRRAQNLVFAPLDILDVTGAAISAGTINPELSYELAKFLTESPQALRGIAPARHTLGIAEDTGRQRRLSAREDVALALDSALTSGFTVADTRYAAYFLDAFNAMRSDDIDAALDTIEVQVFEAQQIAEARRGTVNLTVTHFDPTIPPAEGIRLNFGIQLPSRILAQEARWQQITEQFSADDSEVGEVRISVVRDRNADVETLAGTYDCFYTSTNIVPDADLGLLLPLDPYLSIDPAIDDIIALDQMQLEGQTWGVPLHVQAQLLWMNPQRFEPIGLPAPDWDVSQFETALRSLKVDDNAPFVPFDNDGTYLLMLIAAYGGLPVDYRTAPLTVHFTDETNVQAIRQVLTLAREGYIAYSPLADLEAERVQVTDEVPLYSQIQLDSSRRFDRRTEAYQPLMFPQGSTYTPLTYEIGAAYISMNTASADACYRFISVLGQSPDLFEGMPARQSLIESEYDQELYRRMQQPDAIIFPLVGGGRGFGAGENLVLYWLYRAFDRYVADENTDLVFELREAQTFAESYLSCLAGIPPFEPGQGVRRRDYRNSLTECAVTADPSVLNVITVR